MKKILIVEDHADIRRLIRMTLEAGEYEISEAADAQGGWDLARRGHPDVVLLDVMMPGEIDGLDLCLALKVDPTFANTKVVMLSARGGSADREAGLRAGADAYLVKPFSPMELLALVDELAAQGQVTPARFAAPSRSTGASTMPPRRRWSAWWPTSGACTASATKRCRKWRMRTTTP